MVSAQELILISPPVLTTETEPEIGLPGTPGKPTVIVPPSVSKVESLVFVDDVEPDRLDSDVVVVLVHRPFTQVSVYVFSLVRFSSNAHPDTLERSQTFDHTKNPLCIRNFTVPSSSFERLRKISGKDLTLHALLC